MSLALQGRFLRIHPYVGADPLLDRLYRFPPVQVGLPHLGIYYTYGFSTFLHV